MNKKIGVYINTYNNPRNLRMAVLQVLNQVTLPHYLLVHQNNNKSTYQWALEDIKPQLESKGIGLRYVHTPDVPEAKDYYSIAVQNLYDMGADVFIKWDDDDIYYSHYIDTVFNALENSDADAVVVKYGEKLVVNHEYEFQHDKKFDFKWIHCLGGMSPTLCFTRDVAERAIELWSKSYDHYNEVMWDDKILCYELFSSAKLNSRKLITVNDKIVACYVTDFTNKTAYIEILNGWFQDPGKLSDFFSKALLNNKPEFIEEVYKIEKKKYLDLQK